MTGFEDVLSSVFATFALPDRNEGRPTWTEDSSKLSAISDLLQQLPFPSIRITEASNTLFGPARVEAILRHHENGLLGVFYKRVLPNGRVEYDKMASKAAMDEMGIKPGTNVMWSLVYDFAMMLAHPKQVRYIEKSVTRQQRRALGVVPGYREYVIIRREDYRYPEGMTLSQMYRRSPMLHAVRGHLRRLQNGRLIPVRAHARGKGQLFQVKDYEFATGNEAASA